MRMKNLFIVNRNVIQPVQGTSFGLPTNLEFDYLCYAKDIYEVIELMTDFEMKNLTYKALNLDGTTYYCLYK